ncbi:MAG: T9SS type A sorting domain-containing protein [Bacteroidetes bacterium]|nr:T9SS type A sorting domain-containing protein [Bacteroidota bacterium]
MKKTLQRFSLWGIVLLVALATARQGAGQTVLLTENWETAPIGQTPPPGWGVDLVSGANYTYFLQAGTFPTSYPFNGSRMVEFRSFNGLPGVSNRLKRTTPVSTTGFAAVSVDFEWYTSTGYPGIDDNVAVQWSTNGTTWTTAATFQRSANLTIWQYEVVTLPAIAANQPALYVALLFTSGYGDNCHLDLLNITGYATLPSPPAVATLAPSWVGSKNAYLAGTVNANGNPTNASFQFGLTTSYGTTLSAGTITGNTLSYINGNAYPLIPGHLYHYRAVGTNAGGTTYGNDVTFTTNDTLPEVFTYQATDVTSTSATLNGMVYPNGSATAVTFDYGLTESYGSTVTANPATVSGDSTHTHASALLTGLPPGTSYHYRIKGVNAAGAGYGIDTVFTTNGVLPPTVVTTHATAITSTSAMLNGNVNANGTPTNVTFQYGLTPAYGSTVTFGMVYGNFSNLVNHAITGLTPGTLYHFRAVGENANGTTYGNDSVFTTTIILPPTVTTNPSPLTGATYSILSGTFNANGNQATASFEYGLTTSYGLEVQAGYVSGNTPSTREIASYFLLPSHVYHYRARGTNAGGTTYGNDVTFTTADTLPAVFTYHATNIGLTTATLNGRVYPMGSTTAITFEYGHTTSYGSTITASPATIPGDSVTTWASAALSGLTMNTLYHFRIKGVNATGSSYGLDSVFTTAGTLPPIVITTHATSITTSGATLNGSVNANGTDATVSFQYGLTPSYGSTVAYGTVSGNSMTPVSATVNGLAPSTLYHYRTVGVNANGTAFGNDTTFITSPPAAMPPSVYTQGADSVTSTKATLNAHVNANGYLTTVTFEYGLTLSYGNTVTYGTVAGNNYVYVSKPIAGLSPATLYHFRVAGTNLYGTTYGADVTFTTSPAGTILPTVITTAATDYSASSAVLHGYANANNSATHILFEYGLTSAYGSSVSYGMVYGNTMNPVMYQVMNLLPASEYHYRIVGTNDIGTSYGRDTTFTTNDSISCDAAMTYESSGPFTIQFHDVSTGGGHICYWHFGDGVFSQDPNPVHTYAAAGEYGIYLRIEGYAPYYCYDSTIQFITVSGSPYHHIYGQVFADGVPIPTGIVNLFSVDTIPPYNPYMDITAIDSNGMYNFDMIPDGDYYVEAMPVNVPGYMPTFYGDELFWEDATIIHLGAPANPYDINLVAGAPSMPGNGSINGQINTTGLKTSYVDQITMLLLNANGRAIFYDRVESAGAFSFASLAFGTYYLKAEMAGIRSELIKVVISEANPDPNVILTFTGNSISGIKNNSSGTISLAVYPNPVTDHVSVSISMTQEVRVTAQILDLAGRVLSGNTFVLHNGANLFSLSTSLLPAGVYTLRVFSPEGFDTHNRLVKTR